MGFGKIEATNSKGGGGVNCTASSLRAVTSIRVRHPGRWGHREALGSNTAASMLARASQQSQLLQDVKESSRFQDLDVDTRAALVAILSQDLTAESSHKLSRFIITAGQLINRVQANAGVEQSLGVQPSHRPKTEEEIRNETEEALLSLLQYEVMTNRSQGIAEASAHSCQWIFKKYPPEGKTWNSLPDWLAGGSGVYLLSGTEGSGKSTMMKYIFKHEETVRGLKDWAQSTPLVTAAFFFWRSGTRLEKSEEGLLRSLLYSILSQKPHIMSSVFPKEWATLYSSISGEQELRDGPLRLGIWKVGDLRKAFRRLIHQEQSPLKLFLLIDGMDEYQDTQGNLAGLIELFAKDVAGSPNAKVLISSRPLEEWDALDIKPSVVLHEANGDDISTYVHEILETNEAFQAARDLDQESAGAIISYVTRTAKGVFLWAVLAVKAVEKNLSDGMALSDIQNELERRLPSELHGLYERILSIITEGDKTQAAKILRIVLVGRDIRPNVSENEEALRLVDLTLALSDPKETIRSGIILWKEHTIRDKCRPVAKNFMESWPGFIEINTSDDMRSGTFDPTSRIHYCHRSVLEFLTREDIQKALLEATKEPTFCPYTAHLTSAVQHLKILPRLLPEALDPAKLLWTFATTALLAANQIDSKGLAESPIYSGLLKQLDLVMKHHHESLQRGPDGQYRELRLQDRDGMLGFGDGGRDSKYIAKMHWSNFDPTSSHPRDWGDTFLSLAIQFGLRNYIKAQLGEGSKVLKSKKGRPLLDYALRPSPMAQHRLITPALIKTLLDHGANPSQKFEKKTCWENALLWQYETYVDGSAKAIGVSTDEGRELAETRLEIFRLLIEKGADVQASVEISEGKKFTAKQVVEESFRPWASHNSFQGLLDAFSRAETQKAGLFSRFLR